MKYVILTVAFNVRCFLFMTSTKKGGGMITKVWKILQMVVDGVLGEGILTLLTSTNLKTNLFCALTKKNAIV